MPPGSSESGVPLLIDVGAARPQTGTVTGPEFARFISMLTLNMRSAVRSEMARKQPPVALRSNAPTLEEPKLRGQGGKLVRCVMGLPANGKSNVKAELSRLICTCTFERQRRAAATHAVVVPSHGCCQTVDHRSTADAPTSEICVQRYHPLAPGSA